MKSSDEPGVLFLSRKFPPSTGGMQKFSYQLLQHLEESGVDVTGFTWGGSKLWLPIVLPYLWARAFVHMLFKRKDVVYGTEGLISPLVLSIGKLFGAKTVITLHGLDITFDSALYQKLVVPTFRRHDRVVCVSDATSEIAQQHGVPGDIIEVIPNGIEPDEYYMPEAEREDLEERLASEKDTDIELGGRKILLSVGRLVERKGFHWFVSSVMPELGEEYVYFICGSGPMEGELLERAEEKGLEERVFPLGRVSDELLSLFYNVSDVLVMPNVPVEGDMEGFGIVAIEASSCGTPVLASDMEGMKDSVIEGKNGTRIEDRDINSFQKGVEKALGLDSGRVRELTKEEFNWETLAEKYKEVFLENKT